jgi:hypothetical protein
MSSKRDDNGDDNNFEVDNLAKDQDDGDVEDNKESSSEEDGYSPSDDGSSCKRKKH